jgi:hypothetical protein
LLVFDKVRQDSQAPDRFGATITYNIPLKGQRTIAALDAARIPTDVNGGLGLGQGQQANY